MSEWPGEDGRSEAQLRARKVKPQYGEGPLVKVAFARNQSEAELIAGLLLEEGIPSVIRRNGGFDVPDFLAAGPRDILVAASGEAVAREMLMQTPAGEPAQPRPVRTGTPGPWTRAAATTMLAVTALSTVVVLLVVLLR